MDNVTSQVTTRCNVIDGLVPEIVQNISEMLSNNNDYVKILKTAKEVFEQQDNPQCIKLKKEDHQVNMPGGTTTPLVMTLEY